MNTLMKLAKQYISTGSFLSLSVILYIFSDSNPYAKQLIEEVLPVNGKLLAFTTLLGLIFIYELSLKNTTANKEENLSIKTQLTNLELLIEKRHLISDTNSAFTEFKASGREHITGEYYIKEILTLNDSREKLQVNSYTQNKLDYLVGKIKYD